MACSWLLLASSWAPLRRSKTRCLRTFLWVSPWDLYFQFRGSKKLPLGLFLGSSLPPLGSSWAPLGFLLAPLGLLLGSPETLQDSFFTNVFVGLALGPVFSASGLQKTSSWAPLGSSWAPLGLLSAPLGLLLGSSWLLLAPHGLLLASSWLLFFGRGAFSKDDIVYVFLCSRFPLGLLLGPLGSSWTRLGLLLGSSRPPESCLRTLPSPPSSL